MRNFGVHVDGVVGHLRGVRGGPALMMMMRGRCLVNGPKLLGHCLLEALGLHYTSKHEEEVGAHGWWAIVVIIMWLIANNKTIIVVVRAKLVVISISIALAFQHNNSPQEEITGWDLIICAT